MAQNEDRAGTAGAGVAGAAPAAGPPPIRVLMVDDEPANLIALGGMLENMGLELIAADSGRAALKALLKQDFALIILDVHMPVVDGFEAAALIRQREKSRHTPIIFLTAQSTADWHVFRGYSVGAVDYLFKPIAPEVLRQKVSVFIELYRQTQDVKREAEVMRQGEAREFRKKLEDLRGRMQVEQERAQVAQAQVEQDRTRLSAAVEQAAESIMMTDTAGHIVYVNPSFERVSGYPAAEVLGKNPRLLRSGRHPPEFYRELWETLARGERWSGTFFNRRKDGSIYEDESTISLVRDGAGAIVNYVSVNRDVTNERQMEAQLRQSQKMEAIGLLAGAVAHDFNNMLTIILGQADLLLEEGEVFNNETQEALADIKTASERAAGLTRQLLVFSHKQVLKPRVIELNAVVSNVEKMLRRLIGENIELVSQLDLEGCRVKADPGQIEQVIMNLAVNARDAMPRGGRLRISTRVVDLGDHNHDCILPVSPGRYIDLSVVDTGTGIEPTIRSHIFEPFFTTKEKGKGTGLGLSTTYGIVKQFGGNIGLETEVGSGTTFHIYLPQSAEAEEAPERSATVVEKRMGTETVLLVEDEALVRSVARSILRSSGYRVLEAGCGEDALAVSASHPGVIHLLLTDVVMPGMSGPDLVGRIRPLRPDMRILYASGYTEKLLAVEDRTVELNFIPKPFVSKTLLSKVREVLDRPEPPVRPPELRLVGGAG